MSHVHYKLKKMEFKQPKSINFNQGSLLRNNGSVLSPRRPQPSPSKSEMLLKDLGLDSSDTNLSDSSSSDDSEEEADNRPSLIEFNALQHQLDQRTKERENLLMRNHDFEEKLADYKRKLKREQTKSRSQLKIMTRTNQDAAMDKESLIQNLQDIISENESKIDQLESGIKGTPIQINEPKSSSIQKLVENIKILHSAKSDLHVQLMQLQEKLDEKEADLIQFQEMQTMKNGTGGNKSHTDSEKVVMKLQQEVNELKKEINNYESKNENGIEDLEILKQKNENLLNKMDAQEEENKKLEKKFKSEILNYEKENESLKQTISELKDKKPEVVTNIVEKVVEVESETLKNNLNDSLRKISRLEQSNKEYENISQSIKEENEKLRHKIQSLKLDLSASMHDIEETSENIEEEKRNLCSTIEQLEADLQRQKRNTEKAKGHVTKEKTKVGKLEVEIQELKASVHHLREEAVQERENYEQEISEKENETSKEIEEIKEAHSRERRENEKTIERLEKKILKANEKFNVSKDDCVELQSKVNDKNIQIDELNEELASAEELHSLLKVKFTEVEQLLAIEKQTTIDIMKEKDSAKEEAKLFKNQLQVLNGASDVATVALYEKDKENNILREQLQQLNDKLRNVNIQLTNSQNQKIKSCQELEELNQKIQNLKTHHQTEIQKLEQDYSTKIHSVQKVAERNQEAIASKTFKVQAHLRRLTPIICSLKQENHALRKDCAKFPLLIEEVSKHAAKQITEAITEINDNNAEMVRRYIKEMKLRKKYHNELVELKGNIRVLVRVRPKITEDGEGVQARSSVTFDPQDDAMMFVHNQQRGRSQVFELDKVFQQESTQEEVYNEVQALVVSCIDGYHVCIFAYGQTGSGKTYTMEGPTHDPGINQRALRDLFAEIEERSKDWTYTISVSLVEIYNETLRDLLNSRVEKLEIKMNADGSLYVARLKSIQVNNINNVNELFTLGKRNRATASTNMNEHSSRSHAVLIVNVYGVNQTSGTKTFGKLNLIDLAGSERVSKSGASGDRLEEAKNINRSLSAIGDVIHALRGKNSHVPFRNSKLTYMLQDSLSKDSKTLMMVQVSPVEKNISETICSLSFAQRVRSVELGQASKKTEDVKYEDISAPQKRSGMPKSNTPSKRK